MRMSPIEAMRDADGDAEVERVRRHVRRIQAQIAALEDRVRRDEWRAWQRRILERTAFKKAG